MIANIELRKKESGNVLRNKLIKLPPYDYVFEQYHASEIVNNKGAKLKSFKKHCRNIFFFFFLCRVLKTKTLKTSCEKP